MDFGKSFGGFSCSDDGSEAGIHESWDSGVQGSHCAGLWEVYLAYQPHLPR